MIVKRQVLINLIEKNADVARNIFLNACVHDGIDINTHPTFVVFSDDNPFLGQHRRSMKRMLHLRQQLRSFPA